MLFPSTLIISSSPVLVDDYLHDLGHLTLQNNPDIFTVTDYSVENIRSIKKFLSQKPYSHQSKIVYIPDADLLNIESQNTLLKSLEEPGPENYFILTTGHLGSILPTIISRCQLIRISPSILSSGEILHFPQKISECLSLSEVLCQDKTTVLPYLENQLCLYQQLLVSDPNPKYSLIIKKINKSIQMLSANIDPKNVLDFLLLS